MKLFSKLILATIFVVFIENMVAKYLLVQLDHESKVERGPRGPWSQGKNIWLYYEKVSNEISYKYHKCDHHFFTL